MISRCALLSGCSRTGARASHSFLAAAKPRARVTRNSCSRSATGSQQVADTMDQPQHASLGPDPATDPDKPVYHVAPRQGWANDGNGFIFHEGRYHMFYQHIPDSADWEWRMCWGHASSADLVDWVHEPIALRPTPGGPDAQGCWSGCCAVDQHGVPTILYTGVRLGAGPHLRLPEEEAVGQPVIEVQCAATADPGDRELQAWTKVERPVIPSAPKGLKVTGFRDPFIIQTGGKDRDWLLVLGSGIAGEGGALLLYRSSQLSSGWEYVGPLCVGEQVPGEEHDTGAMWECPIFVPLPKDDASADRNGAAAEGKDYLMCVSPYPHVNKSPTNSCLYWIGRFADHRFDLENASGPFVLDLGDALYAPNCFADGSGRRLLAGWLQEISASRGPSSGFNYSGCLTLPRVITRSGDRLHQAPAPELARLRKLEGAWQLEDFTVYGAKATLVPRVSGAALNVEVTLDAGAQNPGASDATAFSVLLVSDPRASGGDNSVGTTAVTVDWAAATLKVHQLRSVDAETYTFAPASAHRSVGGSVAIAAGEPIHLQVFLDHSALEVFLGTGETLSTRVYKRMPPSAAASAGIALVAHGGSVRVADAQAYEMGTIWRAE